MKMRVPRPRPDRTALEYFVECKQALQRAKYDDGRQPAIVVELEQLARFTTPDPRYYAQQMMGQDSREPRFDEIFYMAKMSGLRVSVAPDRRFLRLSLNVCDICDDRGWVRLVARGPTRDIVRSNSLLDEGGTASYRELPCPQCFGPKANMPADSVEDRERTIKEIREEERKAKGGRFANLDFVTFDEEGKK